MPSGNVVCGMPPTSLEDLAAVAEKLVEAEDAGGDLVGPTGEDMPPAS